ncbi:MAG: NAD(P)-dependent oxidoreductase [Candidatus Tectomicrobia bacterium]|nr:NAD(P)-dependent oxidoreductase [Candidatus Tectomicrobia bacterium]
MGKKKVLITGASGYIASQLLPIFREIYDLTLLDVKETDRDGNAVPGIILADLIDPNLEAHRRHFRGIEAVVHLGFSRSPNRNNPQGYWEERKNVDMAHHVYTLSLEEGVRRVVVASSNHAADWYEPLIHEGKLDMVSQEMFPLSDNFYGWAKATYEHLGFLFACGRFGRKLEVVQIRIGAPREIDYRNFLDNPAEYKRDLGAHISQRDLQQLFQKSIETEHIENEHGIPFQIFYGISNNARRFWSMTNARKVIGYDPQDDSEVKYASDIANFLMGEGGKSVARGRTER